MKYLGLILVHLKVILHCHPIRPSYLQQTDRRHLDSRHYHLRRDLVLPFESFESDPSIENQLWDLSEENCEFPIFFAQSQSQVR